MTRTVPGVETLDLEITVAYIALGVARGAEAHCPSAENTRRVAEAIAAVDALLDQRPAAARRSAVNCVGAAAPGAG